MASTTSAAPAPPRGVWRTTELSSIRYGPGCLREGLDAALNEDLGGRKRALIVTGKSLNTKTDVIKKVKEALGERYVATIDDIGQHAPVDAIHRAVELVKKEKIDVLISVGGGSPIDSPKAVSFYIHEEQHKGNEDPDTFLPSIAIPTTLSVAETTQNAGFTKDGKKTGVSHPAIVPRVLILDAELTVSTPERLWLSSGMRAVDHAVEGLYRPGDFNWLLRNQNLGALRELFPLLRASKADPSDLRVRQKLQLAATISLFPEKRKGNLGVSHALGHALGSTYQIPHGITSCLTLAHAIEYTAKLETTPTEQLLSLADALAYVAPQTNRLTDPAHPISIDEARQKAVEVGVEVGKLVRDLGLSTTLDEWKVPHEDYAGIASHAAGGDGAVASRIQSQILGRITSKGPGTGAGPSSARRLHTSRDPSRRTPPPPSPPPQSPMTFSQVWPALLRCLAYGSVSYFSLHLAWQYMDSVEQRDKMEEERRGMEEAVRVARQRGMVLPQGVR